MKFAIWLVNLRSVHSRMDLRKGSTEPQIQQSLNPSVFRKINLQKVLDENGRVLVQIRYGRVLVQIRITDSLPIIYREVIEDFTKTFQIISGKVFSSIITIWASSDISFPRLLRKLHGGYTIKVLRTNSSLNTENIWALVICTDIISFGP